MSKWGPWTVDTKNRDAYLVWDLKQKEKGLTSALQRAGRDPSEKEDF